MICVANWSFFQLGNWFIAGILLMACLSVALKESGITKLILITCLFYLASKALHCEIKSPFFDWYFRYLAWTTIDALYLCTVYLLLVRQNLIRIYVYVALIYCHCLIWFLHLFRMVDVKILQDINLNFIYGYGIAIANILIVFTIFISLLPRILNKKRSKVNGFSDDCGNSGDGGSFIASTSHHKQII